MSDNAELFRNSLISQLESVLPPDQLQSVLKSFDITSADYDIVRKKMDIIPLDGIPEVVKIFIASKALANCSRKTLDQYRYKLQAFFADVSKPFTDICPNDIRIYLYKYKQTHNISDHTVDITRRVFSSFFQWLVTNGYIVTNPCSSVEQIKHQDKLRIPLTAYEIETIRWNCHTIREKALVDFLFSTGCRVSECSDLNIDDIDWKSRSALIRHGKGDKMRTVFFNAESELTLRKYLEQRNDSDPALFVCSRSPHSRMSSRSIEKEIQKIGKRSGIYVYPHKLRHSFATSGLKGGMSLERLQTLMGHSNPRTTLIYAKINRDDLQREHDRVYNC